VIDFKSEEHSSDMIDLSTTKRCVIYARCSTVFQEESIESQITFNQAFAKQKGITVVGIFQDEGKTGRKDDRDGLKALMAELQNPNRDWDLVLVYRIDRFFRNARLFMEYQYRMRDESVYLLSAQESMLNNIFPMTDTFRFFVAQQAELESHRIGENVARGKITAAQKGRWQGGQPPLGYDVIDGALIINPKEKQAVTMIFEQRAQGVSMQKIADMLKAQVGLNIVMWDERRTSVDANRMLSDAGKKRKKQKQLVDAVAASLILQGYLDYISMRKSSLDK